VPIRFVENQESKLVACQTSQTKEGEVGEDEGGYY
jgi:hypothetical protein